MRKPDGDYNEQMNLRQERRILTRPRPDHGATVVMTEAKELDYWMGYRCSGGLAAGVVELGDVVEH